MRSRLVDRLAGAPVVVLSAPGGYGKSTLAGQLAQSSGAAVIRVALEPGTTADGLVALFARATRRAGMSDLAESLTTSTSATDALDRIVAAFAVRAEPVVLVLDDLHHADAECGAWVRDLVADRPPNLRVIAAGRGDVTPLLGRYAAAGAAVTADDLRFRTDEIAAVLGRDADDPLVATVESACDGWGAALGVAAASLAADPDWVPAPDAGADGLLAGLVRDLLGDGVGELAMLTALPLLSPDVADLVAGSGAWRRVIDSGLPLTRRGDTWWAVPDPIREAVPGQAPPEELAAHVARRYADAGELALACQWLAGDGYHRALAELIASRHWSALAAVGVVPLRAYVELIGDEVIRAEPRVLLHGAWFMAGRDNVRRAAWVRHGASLADPATAIGRAFRAELCHETSWSGQHAEALADCTALLGELAPTEATTRARALVVAANAQVILGGDEALAQAGDRFAEAATIFGVLGETRWESDTWLRAGYALSYHHGRVDEALERLERCLALLPSGSRDHAFALTYYADVLDYAGRVHEAEGAGARAAEIGTRLGDEMIVAYGNWAAAWVCAHRGDLAACRAYLAEVDRRRGRWFASETGVEYLMIAADMLASLGPDTGWERYLDELRERIDGNPIWDDANLSITSRVEAMWGDPFAAEAIFEQRDRGPYARDHDRWIRILLRATAAARRAEPDTARRLVADAVADLERLGMPDLWRRREPVLVGLLADVWPVADGDEPMPERAAHVTLLGGFRVVRGADDVTPAPGNPATLVKLLAVRGTLAAEQVIDELWPDADLATGRSRLRNLLNRVRTQSGDLVVRDAEALSIAPHAEIDLVRFEQLAADATSGAPDVGGLARLALNTYGGDLLPQDAYVDWLTPHRERVRRRYIALLDLAAAAAAAAEEWDEELRLLDAAIEAEPYGAGRYERAIEVLASQGRLAGARTLAVQAQRALAEVGAAPGPNATRLLPQPATNLRLLRAVNE